MMYFGPTKTFILIFMRTLSEWLENRFWLNRISHLIELNRKESRMEWEWRIDSSHLANIRWRAALTTDVLTFIFSFEKQVSTIWKALSKLELLRFEKRDSFPCLVSVAGDKMAKLEKKAICRRNDYFCWKHFELPMEHEETESTWWSLSYKIKEGSKGGKR